MLVLVQVLHSRRQRQQEHVTTPPARCSPPTPCHGVDSATLQARRHVYEGTCPRGARKRTACAAATATALACGGCEIAVCGLAAPAVRVSMPPHSRLHTRVCASLLHTDRAAAARRTISPSTTMFSPRTRYRPSGTSVYTPFPNLRSRVSSNTTFAAGVRRPDKSTTVPTSQRAWASHPAATAHGAAFEITTPTHSNALGHYDGRQHHNATDAVGGTYKSDQSFLMFQ